MTINRFTLDQQSSDTVSRKLQRLVRMLQSNDTPDAVILQEVAALHRSLPSEKQAVISVTVMVESR